MRIIRQEAGRFIHRFAIGPVRWPHFDLLWVHEGAIRMEVGKVREPHEIAAPGGILLFPQVSCQRVAISSSADTSICHFTGGPLNEERFGQLLTRSDPVRQTPYLCKTCCACLWHMRNEMWKSVQQ